MLIELDLDEAKRLKITVTQLILISLIMGSHDIKSLADVIPVGEDDIKKLIELNILTNDSVLNPGNFKGLQITEEFRNKFKVRDFFSEFFDLYPASVLRRDGLKDYLRGDISRCRKYYEKIVGKSKSRHEHIMECLKFEIESRKRANSLGYMKRMAKWLISEEWKLYDEFMKDTNIQTKAEEVYGTIVE